MKFVSDAKTAADFRDTVIAELDRRIALARTKLTVAGQSPRDKAMIGARIDEMDNLKEMFTQVEFAADAGAGGDKKQGPVAVAGGTR